MKVSNTTPDDIDLTFIVVALPPNGRAVAIGYQRFVLQRGAIDKELPLGDRMVGRWVRVDAVGEECVSGEFADALGAAGDGGTLKLESSTV